MKRLGSLPKPVEMQLIDGRENLRQMKENQPKLYRWRALFGAAMLLACAGAGYFLFRDANQIIAWFEGIGPTGPIFYALAVALCLSLIHI